VALQVVTFKGFALSARDGNVIQVPDGAPIDVTANTFTGTYTVPTGGYLVKFSGTGTVTWPTDATPEDIVGPEFRGVRPGDTFVVA